jgi:hypothetical protein
MNLGFWNFYKACNQNLMFTQSNVYLGDDLFAPMIYMARRLQALGHKVSTLDMEPLESYDAAVFLDHPTFLNSYYRRLRRMDGRKLYLFLAENPANRPDNYWRWNHRAFDKIFTWDPTWVDGRKYIDAPLPITIPEAFSINRAEKTKFCVSVVSQKYSGHPRELYSERVRAIRWFEREHPGQFDLFGTSWNRLYFSGKLSRLNLPLQRLYAKYPNAGKTSRFPSWRGAVQSKNLVMRPYKFAIAYENASFPGYVTEKIFDAFFAGCVPVYIGAPNVTDYIPAETFIDKREFPDYPALYRFLAAMTEAEYLRRLAAIEDFVRGPRIQHFAPEAFTTTILQHIVQPNTRPL